MVQYTKANVLIADLEFIYGTVFVSGGLKHKNKEGTCPPEEGII